MMMTASCRGGNKTVTQGEDEARTMTGIHSRTMTARLPRHAEEGRTETAAVVRTATSSTTDLAITTTAAILRVRATERPHVMVIETASCSHLAMIESLILLLVATLLPALSPATSTSESEFLTIQLRSPAPADSRRCIQGRSQQARRRQGGRRGNALLP